MNDCFEKCLTNLLILQLHWNFPNGLFNYIQACIFSLLNLLFNFYAKRTIHMQDFGAKFYLSYHNGAPAERKKHLRWVAEDVISKKKS